VSFFLDPVARTPLLIAAAFALGLVASSLKLPPLVGFILAGVFLRGFFGLESSEELRFLANLGVTLLMFSIGLKLQVKSLLSPVIWGGTTSHLGITTLLFMLVSWGLRALGVSPFSTLTWQASLLLGFALSFSSTVFAVKNLDQRGESQAPHGTTAIGILIMQDIIAVIFLTLSLGKLPSPWAVTLLLLIPLRGLFHRLLERSGHGDLLVSCGLFLGLFVGAFLFSSVGLKADLGALIVGALVAGHPKAKELADVLLGFKEILLIAFFLNIGLSEPLSLQAALAALLLTLALPAKVLLYFFTMVRFRLRVRHSFLSAVTLANFSEFGLIVAAVGVQLGLLDNIWLVIIALALTLSFIVASPLNRTAHLLEAKLRPRLLRFESQSLGRLSVIQGQRFDVLILGMGRVGEGAYDELARQFNRVLGIDFNEERVQHHRKEKRNVEKGDPTDAIFWEKLQGLHQVPAIVLAMSEFRIHQLIQELLKQLNYQGYVFILAHYPDEVAKIQEMGATAVYVYQEAGAGLAAHVHETLEKSEIPETLSRLPDTLR